MLFQVIEQCFELKERAVDVKSEIFHGAVHFVSCLYVLPVVPGQLRAAGFDIHESIAATALACSVGSVLSSYLTNLPFVIAPPTSVSIYFSAYLQQYAMSRDQGRVAVMLSGAVLVLIGLLKSVNNIVTKFIPACIQSSTAVGIGLITALAGLIEIKLVVPGTFTILTMGTITPCVILSVLSVVVVGLALHFHVPGGFVLGLLFGSFSWWTYTWTFPSEWIAVPSVNCGNVALDQLFDINVAQLIFNLVFLYVLTLNGLAKSLSDLAKLSQIDGTIPRGNWLLIVSGLTTIFSGYLCGPPILVSPESAAAIKSGARSGLSALVCGVLFAFSVFLGPFFSKIPASGTSPLLILVGMLLFQNTERIRWSHPDNAIPAFFVILMIPFTCSILSGISFGYVLYMMFQIFNGKWLYRLVTFLERFPNLEWLTVYFIPRRGLQSHISSDYSLNDSRHNLVLFEQPMDSLSTRNNSFTRYRSFSDITLNASSEKPSLHRPTVDLDLQPRNLYLQTYRRTNSMIDQLEMDMKNSVHPMNAI